MISAARLAAGGPGDEAHDRHGLGEGREWLTELVCQRRDEGFVSSTLVEQLSLRGPLHFRRKSLGRHERRLAYLASLLHEAILDIRRVTGCIKLNRPSRDFACRDVPEASWTLDP